MKPTIRAGILTIGTEVSNGQIVNGNAAWLANQLIDLRLEPAWHLTVADNIPDMTAALDVADAQGGILLITGGLGPTADDLTRQVVADWTGDKLIYDEAAWQNIVERFGRMGITPSESNRQQCYFPSRARILSNRKGTAHAFRFSTKNGGIAFCLPGPPEEIHAIWKDHIEGELKNMAAESDKAKLYRWHCLGMSESALGDLVEEIIQGSSLISGYRPHPPYTEVKIWCLESRQQEERHRLDKLDAALDRWTLARDDEDCVDRLVLELQSYNRIVIEDAASAGCLSARLGKKWKHHYPRLTIHTQFGGEHERGDAIDESTLDLRVGPLDEDGNWQVVWKTSSFQKVQTLKLPYRRHPTRYDREQLFVCEMSIAAWVRSIPSGELLA